MKIREQIKRTIRNLAFTAEKALRHFRTHNSQNRGPTARKKKPGTDADPGHVKTYYNNAKEERKLH